MTTRKPKQNPLAPYMAIATAVRAAHDREVQGWLKVERQLRALLAAVGALEDTTRQDWRGPKPPSVVVAEVALAQVERIVSDDR